MNIIIASFIITPTTQMSHEREMKYLNALGITTLLCTKAIDINSSKNFVVLSFAETSYKL